MANHGLSKSRITAWRQCPKRLWLQINHPELKEVSIDSERAFQIGHEVGEIAQRLCPDGILIEDENNLAAAIAATQSALIAYPEHPLFEATFQHDGLLVRADVMLPTLNGYRITEVKSSTIVKTYHVDDCAVQAWVLGKNKIKIESVELAHVDTSFIYKGDGDYHGLLKSECLDAEIEELLEQVPQWVNGARSTLAGSEPCIEPGPQCDDPFECPFKAYCTQDMDIPEEQQYPLDVLYRMSSKKKDELRALGFYDARLVPLHYLNEKQSMIQQVSKTGKPSFDRQAASKEMAAMPYPRYYFDFETITFTVPRWADTSPFSPQVPFQWSCHIEYAPGLLRHEMFLDVSGDDPRRMCAESLVNVLADEGPVFVYYESFEKGRIAELAQRFPDLELALLRINERVVDLLPMARQHYYHPAMKGSWSIKAVLPTIAPDLGYDQLEVGNGGEAQNAYCDIVHPETPEDRRKELTQGLRKYCEMDTMALVRLAWFFEGREVKKGGNHAA